ncbi:hypothetical protein EZS27_006464 [termite gut metagenome]|uniref:eCIS core domain-containing protein n=1 Tax=termite gut metagenome TaxID=433724 RepID=A0A5J4SIA3_9ZZZZ
MYNRAEQSKQQSQAMHGNPKAANQAPISNVLQAYTERTLQRQAFADDEDEPLQRKAANKPSSPNQTSLPDNLKNGVEAASGFSMDNVRLHLNSSIPAQLGAFACTQGTDIHVATGQEKHLGHELWHEVQQIQGRVQPTRQMEGINVNDDEGLEREADVMGEKMKGNTLQGNTLQTYRSTNLPFNGKGCAQMKTDIKHEYGALDYYRYNTKTGNFDSEKYLVGKKTTAILDPNDPVIGTDTGSNSSVHGSLMGAIKQKEIENRAITMNDTSKYVRGHLLNYDLGGQADEYNLYPITGAANKAHSNNVEQPIKRRLAACKEDKGLLIYTIEVINESIQNDLPKATFQCSLTEENSNNEELQQENTSIDSTSPNEAHAFNLPDSDVHPLLEWDHNSNIQTIDMMNKIDIQGPEDEIYELLLELQPQELQEQLPQLLELLRLEQQQLLQQLRQPQLRQLLLRQLQRRPLLPLLPLLRQRLQERLRQRLRQLQLRQLLLELLRQQLEP